MGEDGAGQTLSKRKSNEQEKKDKRTEKHDANVRKKEISSNVLLSDYLLKRVFKKSQRGALDLGFECLCQQGLTPGLDLMSRENLITEQSNLQTSYPTEHQNFKLDDAYVSEPHVSLSCDEGFEANAHKIKFTIEQTPSNPKEDPEPEQNSPDETSPTSLTTLIHKTSSKAIISPDRPPSTHRNSETIDPQSPTQNSPKQSPHAQTNYLSENAKSESQTPSQITETNPNNFDDKFSNIFYKNTPKGSLNIISPIPNDQFKKKGSPTTRL